MAEIRLVGTAHVSQKSIDEVRSAIEEFQPDIVGVELDRGIHSAHWEVAEPSVTDILKGRNFLAVGASFIQQRIGAETGVPGSEMLAAIERPRHQISGTYRQGYSDHACGSGERWGSGKTKLIGALLYSLVGLRPRNSVDEPTNRMW